MKSTKKPKSTAKVETEQTEKDLLERKLKENHGKVKTFGDLSALISATRTEFAATKEKKDEKPDKDD